MEQQWSVAAVVPDPAVHSIVRTALADAGLILDVIATAPEALVDHPSTWAAVIPVMSNEGMVSGAVIGRLRERGTLVVGRAAALEPDHVRAAVRWGFSAVTMADPSYAAVVEVLRSLQRGMEWASTEWVAAIDACAYDLGTPMDEREELVMAALASGETITAFAERVGAEPSAISRIVRGVRERLVGQTVTPGRDGYRGDK